MKRIISVLLALALMLPCVGTALGEEALQEKHLTDYDVYETVWGLISCAQYALEDGMDGKQVLTEMYALADAAGFLDKLQVTCGNIAAEGGKTYEALVDYLGLENENQPLEVWDTPAAEVGDWSVYDCPEVSDEFRALIKDSKAQYCFRPAYWPEDDFKKVLGTSYSQFKPTRSKAGFACVVIKKGAENRPDEKWTPDLDDNWDFMMVMNALVDAIVSNMGDDAPVFTGNPHLASSFWVFDVSYPFYNWYGSNGQKEVKGYDLNLSLKVVDAEGKKTLAEVKYTDRLESSISYWDDGKAWPEFPDVYEIKGLQTQADKLSKAIRKERAAAESNQSVTYLNVEKVLASLLTEQADKVTDAWQKAVWESGARDVKLDGDTIVFTLRSYNPRVSELGKYKKADDKDAWFRQMLENMTSYDLELSLPLENGKPTSKGLSALKKAVKAAGEKAKAAFEDNDDIAAAFIEWLFPSPVSGKITDPEELLEPDDQFKDWADSNLGGVTYAAAPSVLSPLFYSQKKQALEWKNGPTALTITVTGEEPGELLYKGMKAAMDTLAFLPVEERDLDRPGYTLLKCMAQEAVAAHKSAKTKLTFPLNLDRLAMGEYPEEYVDYISAIDMEYQQSLLGRQAKQLPDVAAQEMPKNGKMSGGKGNCEVVFKLNKDSSPTYVQFVRDDTEELAATLFIHPGKQVSVKVAKGTYRVIYCSGPYWYGEDVEYKFGDSGSYQMSDPVQVKGQNYTLTITLVTTNDGDLGVRNVDPSVFKKPQ